MNRFNADHIAQGLISAQISSVWTGEMSIERDMASMSMNPNLTEKKKKAIAKAYEKHYQRIMSRLSQYKNDTGWSDFWVDGVKVDPYEDEVTS